AAVSAAEEYIFKHHPSLGVYIASRKNLIELGHGLGQANKVKHVIDPCCLDPDKTYTHYGFDVAGSVAEKLPYEYDTQSHIRGEGVTSNWFDTNLFEEIDNKCYLILGGSIGNYEDADVVRLLSRLTSDSLYTGRPIIVSHFLAPQEPNKKEKIDTICAGYKTTQVEKFIMRGFAALGLDTSAMQLAVTYEESKIGQPARVRVGAKLLKSMKVNIGNGKTMSKRAGEHIWAISSRRYTAQQFEAIAKQAGCSIKHTASHEHMGVSVLLSRRKAVPTSLKYAALGLASLLAAFQGGMYFNQWLQIKAKQKQMHDLTIVSLANNFRSDHYDTSLDQAISYHEKDMNEFFALLQQRYGANLSDEQMFRVQALFVDWVRKNGFNVSAHMNWGQGMMYDPHLLFPHDLDRFVRECRTSLANEGIHTYPNHRLAAHDQALSNTYHYKGPRQEFYTVRQLDDYKGYIAGTYEDGSLNIQQAPAGIASHDGKSYLVFQIVRDGPYVLEQRPTSLYGYDMSPQKYISDIVGKGHAKILAEQIRDFLNEKYGAGFTPAVNGQQQIVKYIMDMYAAGYDLSYLLNAGTYDPYRNTKELLDVFVIGYLIPDIGPTLRTADGGEKMYDLDWVRIDTSHVPAIRPTLQKVETYMQEYLALYTPDYDPAKHHSLVLKHLMLDRAWRHLETQQDIRCRLLEHSDEFAQDGIRIPPFPSRVEEQSVGIKQSAQKHMSVPSGEPGIETEYASMIWNRGYVLNNGDIINLAHYQTSWVPWGESIVVGQQISPSAREQLWTQYQSGMHGKLYYDAGRGISTQITEKSEVITALIARIPYSTEPLQRILDDYQERKAAWKAYQDKKR
ncbi:MAG: L-histidine N(alpha)-methyltransferase, partial [Candidatus Absconditabacterales bacterium]